MIEIKNLSKTYRPKRGLPVVAIDRLSLSLPEQGMIFLLGRSGSGKSTLLHLLGGLDRYDAGEICVFGRSTKDFSQSELDSYRNTYVGFVFQEYNLLDELTVGANVALAIELQGRRAEDHEVNAILAEVDLAGYGARRPNELSGGQKQRVAIARALVKSPKIIMADEPSAALDEQTGRAVFDTLKRLSRERLVIVVSHDREFAETYADRIVELVDGRVAADRTAVEREAPAPASGLRYTDTAIEIPAGYRITEEDRAAINAYLAAGEGGTRLLPLAREDTREFLPTEAISVEEMPLAPAEEDPPVIKKEDTTQKKELSLVRSRLPLKTAFRIGVSALSHKRIRLFFTVLLSVTAFILFGMTATIFSYDHVRTASRSLIDSNIRYASFRLVEAGDDYYIDYPRFGEEDFEEALVETGLPLAGVFVPSEALDFSAHIDQKTEDYLAYGEALLTTGFSGFAEIGEERLREYGYTLMAGRLPNGAENEIMISDYVLESFLCGGYATDKETPPESITQPADILGKQLFLGDIAYTVVGVYDTDFDFSRYDLLSRDFSKLSDEDMLAYLVMAQECSYEKEYSLASLACVGEGFLDRYFAEGGPLSNVNGRIWYWLTDETPEYAELLIECVEPFSATESAEILWVNGEKTTLAPNEIILSWGSFVLYNEKGELVENNTEEILSFLSEHNGITVAYSEGGELKEKSYQVVGYIPVGQSDGKDALYEYFMYCAPEEMDFFAIEPGKYSYVVAPMPRERAEIEQLVALGDAAAGELRLEMVNSVMFELNTLHEILLILRDLFLYMGIFFAVFAALLFSNFIGTSVVYKKREIGILRAIGSRSRDVFCIFFAESFVIAVVSFLLSALGTGLLAFGFNQLMREGIGLLVSLLDFGILQIGLLLLISMALAFAASFLPVWRIASRRPIDAIRDR